MSKELTELQLPYYIEDGQYLEWGICVPTSEEIADAAQYIALERAEKPIPLRLKANAVKSNAFWLEQRVKAEQNRTDEEVPEVLRDIMLHFLEAREMPDNSPQSRIITDCLMERAHRNRSLCAAGVAILYRPEDKPDALRIASTSMPESEKWQGLDPYFRKFRNTTAIISSRAGSRKRTSSIIALPIRTTNGSKPSRGGTAWHAAEVIACNGGDSTWNPSDQRPRK